MANTRRENRLEELGRVDAEKAYTKKGKRNLKDEKKRIVRELNKKKDDEDTGGDGPEAPVVAPVTEEIEDSYAMAEDWLQGYRDLKAKQALSASLQEKWADERQWQQETMFANSGGLANLFRVKKQ